MPAAAMSLGFTRTSGAPWERSFGRILRPIGVRTVSTRWPISRNISGRKTNRARRALDPEGDMSALLSREPGRVLLDHLDRDLGARVPGSNDEHPALLELRRVPVLAGMELHDARVELARERRHAGDPWLAIATTTLSASKTRSLASTTNRLPFLDSRSTRTPVRTGSSNLAA